nr:gliding motility-associated C-terminal domain-containing protein [Saprospiraceae bacterium]
VEVGRDDSLPDISVVGDTLECNQVFGQIFANSNTPNVEYEWYDPQGMFFTNNPNPIVNQAGFYTIKIIAQNGCTVQSSVEVFRLFNQINTTIFADTINCKHSQAQLIASTSTNSPTYQWSSIGGIILGSNDTLFTSFTGDYILFVQDNNGCSSRDTITVIADFSQPMVQLPLNDTINCQKQRIALSVHNQNIDVMYTWYHVNTNTLIANSDSINVDQGGDYRIIVEGLNGCKDSTQITIVVDTLHPVILVDDETLTCTNSTVQLSPQTNNTNLTWGWTGPNFVSSEQNPLVSEIGVYIVTATLPNACFATDSVAVLGNDSIPVIMLSFADTLNCNTSTTILSAQSSIPLTNYHWYADDIGFNSILASPSISDATLYHLTGTATNGCISNASIVVPIDTLKPILTLANDTLNCQKSQILLDFTIQGFSIANYTWIDDSNNIITQNSPALIQDSGNYLLEIEGNNGCIDSFTKSILIDTIAPIFISAINDTITCAHAVANLSIQTQIENSIHWINNTTGDTFDNTPFVTTTQSGWFDVIIESANHCKDSTSLFVEIDTLKPNLLLITDSITCNQPSANIFVNNTNDDNSIIWYSGNAQIGTNDSILISQAGTYTIYIEGENGCSIDSSFQINAYTELPDINISASSFTCSIDSARLSYTLSNPSSIDQILWYNADNSFQSTLNNVWVFEIGTYYLQATNIYGCSQVDSIVISNTISQPIADAGQDQIIHCDNAQVILNGENSSFGSNITYQWTTIDGIISSDAHQSSISTNTPAYYYLTVLDSNTSCSSVDSVLVLSADDRIQSVDYSITNPICYGELNGSIQVTNIIGGSSPYYYSTDGDHYSTNDTWNYLAAGTYSIFVRDTFGCLFVDTITIFQPDSLIVSLGADTTIDYGTQLVLTAQSNANWSTLQDAIWTPSNPCEACDYYNITIDSSRTVIIHIIDENGCIASDTIFITARNNANVFIPNTFSPNHDGMNDIFWVFANADVDIIEDFKIFNRWGGIIYEVHECLANDLSCGWDGTYQGQALNPSVFVYQIKVKFNDKSTRIFVGDITLLK